MTNEVIYCISNALSEEFGEGKEICMEEIKQGLNEPCFFISLINSSTKVEFGTRYKKNNDFCIQYFPKDSRRECNEVAERMTDCLEYIKDDTGFIHGTDMHYQVTDSILNFFVSYNFYVRKQEKPEEKMQKLEIGMKKKEKINE